MSNKTLISIGIGIVVILGLLWLFAGTREAPEIINEEPENGEVAEIEYQDEDYSVSLTHPSDWSVSEVPLLDGTPAINVYPEGQGDLPPYSHHDNVTNVSVFPNGIPTEGLFGETRPLNLNLGFQATGTMFVLDDGTPFAAYIRPINPPESWEEAGFVWIRVGMGDLESTCFDEDEEELSPQACDPLTEGHQIVWSGTRNQSDWNEVLEIVRSIQLQ